MRMMDVVWSCTVPSGRRRRRRRRKKRGGDVVGLP